MPFIRSCPFCGREPKLETFEVGVFWCRNNVYAVRCDCTCMVHYDAESGYGWWTADEAIAAWNTRSEDVG